MVEGHLGNREVPSVASRKLGLMNWLLPVGRPHPSPCFMTTIPVPVFDFKAGGTGRSRCAP